MSYQRQGMHFNASPLIFERAKILRKNATTAKLKLWEHLKNKGFLGLKFRFQHPALKYILDFYGHSIKLSVEIDGEVHNVAAEKLYDTDRSNNLQDLGITELRFKNSEVINDIDFVLSQIKGAAQELAGEK